MPRLDITRAPLTFLFACLGALSAHGPALPTAVAGDETAPQTPTLFLIGDSTVKNGDGKGAGGLWGWGTPLAARFDPAKIRVENRARGGRSSRTYLTEGLWDEVRTRLKPGDFVLMQFGHNDGGPIDAPRASLRGNGEETKAVKVEATGKEETVHTYGWYLRSYAADARAKGATPIVLSPIPRNIWTGDGKVARSANSHAIWAAEAAKAAGTPFIDLNAIVARRYEAEGPRTVQERYFTAKDHTHTTAEGARVNADALVEGIRTLKDCPLAEYLSPGADAGAGTPVK